MANVSKCKSCGNNLNYDEKSGKLFCQHCNNYYDFNKPDWDKVKKNLDLKYKEQVYNKSHTCPNCGNKEKFNPDSLSFRCSYCGTPLVISSFKNDIDAVAPFKINHEQALSSYKQWISSKIWAPRKLKKLAKVGKFIGHFLPTWAFDADTVTKYDGTEIIQKKVARRTSQGQIVTVIENIQHRFYGTRNDKFTNVITAGNNTISNEILEKLEPFDYINLKVYRDEYLFGYVLDNYSIGIEQGYNMATQEISRNINNRIRSSRNNTVTSLNTSITYQNQKQARYLLPIWSSSFKYHKKNYDFYINGCSGKVVGKTPISILKVLLAVIFGIAIAGLIIYLIMRG